MVMMGSHHRSERASFLLDSRECSKANLFTWPALGFELNNVFVLEFWAGELLKILNWSKSLNSGVDFEFIC